jgi:hypothetical protein
MNFDSGTLATLFLQTVAYIVAGWRYVQSLNDKMAELRSELNSHKVEMDLRLSAVERKDNEINQRLGRMEQMLVEIRLELKDKADRHA